jgi:hypothetical protein
VDSNDFAGVIRCHTLKISKSHFFRGLSPDKTVIWNWSPPGRGN